MLFISERTDPGDTARRRQAPWPVVAWLLTCCALVFAMVLLGGVTRLTGSGLSMVDWQPIRGVVPPLNQDDWMALFAAYQQFPEFREVNHGMDLAGFKRIFLFEYGHRMLGRLIGLAFALPLAWFWWRGRLHRVLKGHLVALLALGGAQGLLGWFMVQSGLVDVPRVSPYRLTAHLLMAVIIYGYMLFIALELAQADLRGFMRRAAGAPRLPALMLAAVLAMIASGGFVAGTHAGYIYNTFPDMNGEWIPGGIFAMSPWWQNLFENPVTIQFGHRLAACLLLVLAIVTWWRADPSLRRFAGVLLALVLAQALLGITTLLHQVPVPLGASHQAGAMLVFTAAVVLCQRSRHVGG